MSEFLSHQEVLTRYPYLAGYFPANEVAQLLGDRRLRSAEEKIGIFGGVTQIGNNIHLAQKTGSEVPYIILLACDRDPMINFEIIRFTYIATEGEYLLAVPTLGRTIKDLLKEGFLNPVNNITLLIHQSGAGDYKEIPNRTGYSITVGKAIEKRAKSLTSQEAQTPQLIPQPRPI